MPNVYQRKSVSLRGTWTEEKLRAAMDSVQKDGVSINAAANLHGIPRKTFERRLKKQDNKKRPMGPSCAFGQENEKKFSSHIKEMQKSGFPFTIDDVRKIAYQFAEELKIPHKFNKGSEKAGYVWLQSFLRRNPEITLRKSEGVSFARSQALNKSEVKTYFELLEKTLTENDLINKPNSIFNMDETGMQLNNRPGHVLAKKGSKVVSMVTSTEKGETITVIGCCNAEGYFLPPACIIKGKNKKPEYEDGMPPGSVVFMSVKSAYITSEIFLEWLKVQFVPRKPPGKVLLLLDGHSTHCNSVAMLTYAKENDIILLSLPSHTSHFLQPLDRTVFKPLKTYYYEFCRLWIKQNPGRRITRLQFGMLLNQAWGKTASVENAVAGFRATGVFPFNPECVPDYAFTTEYCKNLNNSENILSVAQDIQNSRNLSDEVFIPQPSTSTETDMTNSNQKITPSKMLNQISPIPQKLTEARKRAKQLGILLTSEEHIENRKVKEHKKFLAEKKSEMKKYEKLMIKKENTEMKTEKTVTNEKINNRVIVRKRKAICKISDSESNSSDDEPILDMYKKEENICRGCGENYFQTKLIEDWLQCVLCKLWVYENCTEFEDMCSKCGNTKKNSVIEGGKKGKGKKSLP